jgi:pimeloyl-ACP methyl ester carboxylesterase
MPWLIGIVTAVGCVLGVLALFTQLGVSRMEREFAPQGTFMDVGTVRLHYREAGTGPALVLVHGASTNLRDFSASIFEPLSRTHRVIAIDRPGHGFSERPEGDWPDPGRQAEWIHQLLLGLKVENPVLVGHSWSGSVVLAYMLAYPKDAAAGVLLAGATHPWPGAVAWYNDLAGIPVIGELFVRTLVYPLGLLALDGAVASVFAPNPVPEHYNDTTGVRLSLRPGVFRANAEDTRRLSNFLRIQSRRYAEIQTPLLLLTGSDDTIVPAWNHSDRLYRQAAHVERVQFDDNGHALHHAHPDRVVALITAFSDQQQRAGHPVEVTVVD